MVNCSLCSQCCPSDGSVRQQRSGGYYDVDKDKWVDDTCFCKCFAERDYRHTITWFIFFPVLALSWSLGIYVLIPAEPIIISERYDDISGECRPCTITIDIEQNFTAPILFSYELVNFWQNHRVYLNSRSDDQLGGDVMTTKGCSPSSKRFGDVIYPCGLLPQSIFTDRFTVTVTRGDKTLTLCPTCPEEEAEIVWEDYWESFDYNGTWERTGTWGGLTETKFATPDAMPDSEWTQNSSFLDGTQLLLPDPDDSDMIVWLYTATKPIFKKPHRLIRDFDFQEGDVLHVRVFSYFDAGDDAQKYFHFETTPTFGSSAKFLGISLLGIALFTCCITMYAVSPFGHRNIRPLME